MKKLHTLTLLLVSFGLLFATANVFASPAGDLAKPNKTPGPPATHGPENKGNNGQGQGHDQGQDQGQGLNQGAGEDQGVPKATYKGVLDSISATNLTLKLASGELVTVALTDKTQLKGPGGPKRAPTLADLKVGLGLLVQASVASDGQLTALRLQLMPVKPVQAHHVGTVTAYTPGQSITIQAKDGTSVTYTLTEATKLLPAEHASEIAVGRQVTIIAPRSLNFGETLTATGVVLHIEDENADATDDQDEDKTKGTPEPTEQREATRTPTP